LGIPAIVADTSAARDLVIDGVTGLWFKGGDLYDLKEKMRRFAVDAEFAAKCGLAAYQRFWADPPTLERHVKELLGVYSHVLAD
jgi:glycosyltransferase involved in cell wall biosynthesis